MVFKFKDGMKQHQKLDKPIITPTTKDDDDLPITEQEILDQQILTKKEWDLISKAALELYDYGVVNHIKRIMFD